MKIAEVAKHFDLSTDTLRYYERIGIIDPVSKNSSGMREYTNNDLTRIKFIKCMRTAGLSIAAIKQYIALFNQGNETIPKRKEVLLEQKKLLEAKMSELQYTLDYLNDKLDTYDETLGKMHN